jgi:glycosyltransferase involved in cell wall biosynthesis
VPAVLFLVENASVPTDPRVWPECTTLRDAGWDVVAVSPRGAVTDTAPHEVVDGVDIHRFAPSESGGGIRGYLTEYVVALRAMARLTGELTARRAFDVVHVANPPDVVFVAARAARRRGAALIFDQHDLGPELFETKFGRRRVGRAALVLAERLAFSRADVVIAANESFKRIAVERGRRQPGDVFVVRNGPDPDVFRPVDGDPSLRRGATHLIGYVGRMGSQDGLLEAVEALASLRRRRSDWHAVFVGDGESLPDARAHATRLGISDHLSFAGFVSDQERLVQIIASCDVCLSPEPRNALNESSTLIKVAEYMAVAKPVVAFDLRETRATAGDSASYATADTPDAFADAIDRLLDDGREAERKGRLGRERVLADLSWSRSEPALLAAYERARERGTRRRGRSR